MSDEADKPGAPKRKRKKHLEPAFQAATKRELKTSAVPAPASSSASANNRLIMAAVLACAAGGAAGWFIRDARASSAPVEASADPAASSPAAAGSAGVCANWAKAVCDGAGAESETCEQATSASALLPAGACTQAMTDLAGTLERAKSARSSCDTLVEKLCADLGAETETCKMVRAKTPGMPSKQCGEMLKSYDRVLDELQQMEKQNAPLTPEVAAKQAAGDAPSFGPADAKVTLVEYSDFECPYCAIAAKTVSKLKEKYGKVVRFVFRQYPLPFHDNAQLTAEASLAAHAQGKFWAFHDEAFANQKALSRADLEKYAAKAGLDMAKFKKALDDHTYADAVKADMKLGEEIGVGGTPTLVIGLKRAENPSDFDAVSAEIDAQLAAAGVTVPEGGAEAPKPEEKAPAQP
jgi:protein-disulfide isomerase